MASRLDQFISTLNRGTLATLALSLGIIFIILNDPPITICDSQVQYLKDQQKGFLFPQDKKKGATRTAHFMQMAQYCEEGKSAGACFEFFSKMKFLIRDLKLVPQNCVAEVGSQIEIQKSLWGTIQLLSRSAWGAKPPDSFMDRYGWLDPSEVALYCDLKNQIVRIYGESDWTRFVEKQFQVLPGAQQLSRNEVWQRSLISEDCKRF